eukprot:TRINITY_DN11633_c0_g1_i1.p1 TRINITY_DN11633_c0_g1~~TRINITY_DN11633_c0_g1_i1.p1  ORF type:complete len:314 (-),score=40.57 TRINITY_DN11633_c0_g1_i1:178-1011(-)
MGNIPRTLLELLGSNARALNVLEIGCGTGRLTAIMQPHVKELRAFDAHAHMLEVCEKRLVALPTGTDRNWTLKVSEHTKLDCEDNWADVVVAGWTLSYVESGRKFTGGWETDMRSVFQEIRRVSRVGAQLHIFETQGIGTEEPRRSGSQYYALLERMRFTTRTIRTDYRFASFDEGVSMMRFFFGKGGSTKMQEWANVLAERRAKLIQDTSPSEQTLANVTRSEQPGSVAAQVATEDAGPASDAEAVDASFVFPECSGVWSKTIDEFLVPVFKVASP